VRNPDPDGVRWVIGAPIDTRTPEAFLSRGVRAGRQSVTVAGLMHGYAHATARRAHPAPITALRTVTILVPIT
jgi:hypothetical protein